jgi:hypothetical protein
MKNWTAGLTIAFVAGLTTAATAASPFDDLLVKIPGEANVAMAADVQALFRSELGAEKKWQKKVENDFRSGLINTPPTALRFLVGESFDYATLTPRWRIKVNQLSRDCTPERVAQRFGGTIDTVAGLPVNVCPRDQLFVHYSPTLVAEIVGVQRQELARWLRTTTASASSGGLSPYLKRAVESVGGGAQAVMAFDLQDVFHGSGLEEKLRDCKSLEAHKADLAKIVKTLEGLQGAQVRIKVTSEIQGELCLDFANSPECIRPVGKAMILEALDHIGADLEDMKAWDYAIEGNRFVLRGKLTQVSARLLLSPVDNRASRLAKLDSQAPQQIAHLDAKGISTVDYYRSVIGLLDDIEPGSQKANSTEKRTFYYKQYAEKIDSLPILNVDPQVLQFGQAISITLRNLSRFSSMTKTQYENNLAQYRQGFAMDTYGGYYGGYYGGGYGNSGGGWAYSTYSPSAVNVDNFMEVRNMMASTAQTSQALREQTWFNIKQAKQVIRKYLVDKYQVEI